MSGRSPTSCCKPSKAAPNSSSSLSLPSTPPSSSGASATRISPVSMTRCPFSRPPTGSPNSRSEGGAELFFFIVAALYAAELIWRERDTHFSGIHDALPIFETTDWFSKLPIGRRRRTLLLHCRCPLRRRAHLARARHAFLRYP